MAAQFKDDHARLRELIEDYISLIAGFAPLDVNEVMRQRTQITSLFHAHRAAETRAFESLRTGDPDNPVDRLLREHAAKAQEVFIRHSALIQNWPLKRILAERQGYARDIRAQREFSFQFLAWEEANIHPLLPAGQETRRAS